MPASLDSDPTRDTLERPTCLELFCLLAGEEDCFSVQVPSQQHVSEFQEAIIKKIGDDLIGINAHALRLWKIDAPVEDAVKLTDESADTLAQALESEERISRYWQYETLKRRVVHVLVAKPPALPSLKPEVFSKSPHQSFVRLYEIFWKGEKTTWENKFMTRSARVPDIETLDPGEEVTYTMLTLEGEADHVRFPSLHRKLLVTKRYEDLQRLVSEDDEFWLKSHDNSYVSTHASVIIGQPGIGKSAFMEYLLVHRLQNKLPTIFFDNEHIGHAFTSEGVKMVSLKGDDNIHEMQDVRCCALIDFGYNIERIPRRFYAGRSCGCRLVIAVPLGREFMQRISKRVHGKDYYLTAWDWKDIYCASLVQGCKLDDIHEHNQKLRDAYVKFAGIPRRCLASDTIKESYIREIHKSAEKIFPFDKFMDSIILEDPFPAFGYFLTRLEVEAKTPERKWPRAKNVFSTNYVAQVIFDHLREYKVYNLSEVLGKLLSDRNRREYAGLIFEQAAHYTFRRGAEFEVTLLPRDSGDQSARSRAISIHSDDPTITSQYHALSIHDSKDPLTVDQRYLHRHLTPMLKTAGSIDSIVVTEDATYLFKMTVSQTHPLDRFEIGKVVDALPVGAKRNIVIVFVVPANDRTIDCYTRQPVLDSDEAGSGYDYPQYVHYLDYRDI